MLSIRTSLAGVLFLSRGKVDLDREKSRNGALCKDRRKTWGSGDRYLRSEYLICYYIEQIYSIIET